jgi:hypothetical protein
MGLAMRTAGAGAVAFAIVMAACTPDDFDVTDLVFVTTTRDGRMVQADVHSGSVRLLPTPVPRFSCAAVADRERREAFVAYFDLIPERSLYRVDAETGRVLARVSYDSLVATAGLDPFQLEGDCSLVLTDDGLLYTSGGRTGASYSVFILDSDDLTLDGVLRDVPVVPQTMAVVPSLPSAPTGALVIYGTPLDADGRYVRGVRRLVAYDVVSLEPIPELDLTHAAGYAPTELLVDNEDHYAYSLAYPSLVKFDLWVGTMESSATAAAIGRMTGPLDGLLYSTSEALDPGQPDPGFIYVYDTDLALRDSIDLRNAGDRAPPAMVDIVADADGDELLVYIGTSEVTLGYETQQPRIAVVNRAAKALTGLVMLGVWATGWMLVFF